MCPDIPRLLIAATSSGCGKSVITTGLMAEFAERYHVRGYKVGPDYIDPMYHTLATGKPSRNLDLWMTSPEYVLNSFVQSSREAELAIIEGVMGLYDGLMSYPGASSTSEVAKLLNVPVILVLDAGRLKHSVGAVVLGCRLFDPELKIGGVILNNLTENDNKNDYIRAIESIDVPILGCIPHDPSLLIPERHLGLFTAIERPEDVNKFLHSIIPIIRRYVDVEEIWNLAKKTSCLEPYHLISVKARDLKVKIGVARDNAFCFYYEDNLEILRAAGAEIIFFSPLEDADLPEGLDGIYLGGGYPELYLEFLSNNQSMLVSLRQAFYKKMPLYAECGGLMYLTEGVQVQGGSYFPLVGIIPGQCTMQEKLRMGYRIIKPVSDNYLFSAQDLVKGHEFHYSTWDYQTGQSTAAFYSSTAGGTNWSLEGYHKENLIASYIHIHFGCLEKFAERLIAACSAYNANRHVGH